MSSNVVNQVAYLRTSRSFPLDPMELSEELSKSYVDTAESINVRTIGIFPTNRPAITGESWFLTSRKQQTLRQVYTFTGAGNVPHGINFNSVAMFSQCFGSYTDGTNYYGAIYASDQPIIGQFTFYITDTNIVVIDGTNTPIITEGIIVLTWLSKI